MTAITICVKYFYTLKSFKLVPIQTFVKFQQLDYLRHILPYIRAVNSKTELLNIIVVPFSLTEIKVIKM